MNLHQHIYHLLRCVLVSCLFVVFPVNADSDFNDIFASHSAIMLLIEPSSGKIVKANVAAQKFYGYSQSQLEAMSIQDINMLSAEQVASERELAKSENRSYFIFRHQLRNGEVKTVAVHSVPILYQQQQLLFSVIQDYSAERRLQPALWHYQGQLEATVEQQESQINQANKKLINQQAIGLAFLSLLVVFLAFLLKRKKVIEEQNSLIFQIVEQSPVSIVTTDPNGKITYVNKQVVTSTGYSAQELIGKKPSLLKSGEHNQRMYQDLWQTITNGKQWVGEFLNRRKNGDKIWERANIYPLKTTHGDVSAYVAIKEDISQQKLDEKELRLASTVFKTAAEAVMVTDSSNRIVAVNQAFTHITGYEEVEVLGQDPSILSSGHHDQQFYQVMMQSLAQSDQWQGEICNRRKNGEVYYEWLSITAIRDNWGQLESYVSIFSDITKRKKAEDKIYHQANYDSLTGLANRNLFVDRFEHSLAQAGRDHRRVAVLFIDLDGFKHINDTLGHSSGDILLKQTAQRLLGTVRKTDTVCRLSGDEFAIILMGNADVFSIEKVASKILADLALPFQLADKEGFVTASVGISMFPDDGIQVEELLRKADSAMYKAKDAGKNNYQFFTKEMDVKAHQRRELELSLRQALSRQEFHLLYQPIHCSEEGKVTSAEALIRWQHPEKGLIAPADFISVAEDIGLIGAIGEWVLHTACAQAQEWSMTMPSPPKITVNISSAQLQRRDFVTLIKNILAQTGLPPTQLTLEITESLLLEEDKVLFRALSNLRDMGVGLAIDDFGTGYSALSYLKRFPINILKIDRSFIQEITQNIEDKALVCAILSIAKSLKLSVVAEGVETLAQRDLLTHLGCQYQQGYYYARPLTPEAFHLHCSDSVKKQT